MTYDTLAAIHANCDEVGDCLLWRGRQSPKGYPVSGKPRLYLRRVVFALAGGILAPGARLTTKCGERKCLNPGCIVVASYSALAVTAHKTAINRTKWRASLSAAARARRSKLDWEAVCAIRERSESAYALAARYDVNRSTIYLIWKHLVWQDYSSPWQGLAA